jgi:hypothetical protein
MSEVGVRGEELESERKRYTSVPLMLFPVSYRR